MSELHWLPIAGTLCGFRGNPNPGSTERAVCVAEVRELIPPIPPNVHWSTGIDWGVKAHVADAQRAAEAAVGDGE